MKNTFLTKQKIVLNGDSSVLTKWQEFLPDLTKEAFIEALAWVCDDPLDAHGMLTREVGLTRKGLMKLQRSNDARGNFIGFYTAEGRRWEGDFFRVPCTKKYISDPEKAIQQGYADGDGKIKLHFQLSLNAHDRV